MNHCRENIERKISQAKYALKSMQKYRRKVFVNGGLDSETGAYPLQVEISSFITTTRSVLQYALKECKRRGKLNNYESSVRKRPIIALFRDLRNTDVHEKTLGTQTTITADSRMYKTKEEAEKYSQKAPKEAKVITHLTMPLTTSIELIDQLRNNGQEDLSVAAEAGEQLYQAVEFEGEYDLFSLCDKYMENISEIISELVQEGGIS